MIAQKHNKIISLLLIILFSAIIVPSEFIPDKLISNSLNDSQSEIDEGLPSFLNDLNNNDALAPDINKTSLQKNSMVNNPSVYPTSNLLVSDTIANTWYNGEKIKVDFNSKNNTVKSLDFSTKTDFDFLLEWGSTGTGDSEFDVPYFIDVDSTGNVYVADMINDRVQKFDSTGTFLLEWGTPGTGDGQFGTNSPQGIAVDSFGDVYVTDPTNDRIQKFNNTGTYLSQFGTGGTGNGQFDLPGGIAVDSSGNIYVADTYNHRVQIFNSTHDYISLFGSSGSGDGQFSYPLDIAVDSLANIYVVDTVNHRVQKFNSTNDYVSQFGSQGTGDAEFDFPQSIAIDVSGNLYVVDAQNNRIQKFDSSATYLSQFGQGPIGGGGTGEGEFDGPQSVAVAINGDIYVVDQSNDRIQKFGQTVTATTPLGELPFSSIIVDAARANGTISETVDLGFTYYDLVNPSELGIIFSWSTKKSAIYTPIFTPQELSLSVDPNAIYSASELKITLTFTYSGQGGFTAEISAFDTGLNQLISTSTTSGVDYFAFDNSIIKIDSVWAKSPQFSADIPSQFKYTSNYESIIHVINVAVFDYRIPLEIYAPLNWTYSSINPSAIITYNPTDNTYEATNTVPTTYEITFTSGNNYSMAIEDRKDLLKSPSFEDNFDDWEESTTNPFDTIERQTQIVSNGIFALNLTDSNSFGELLFKPSGNNFSDGTYYISFDYYVIDLPEDDYYFIYKENGTLISNSLPTTLNRWHKLYYEIQLSDGIINLVKLSFQSASGSYHVLIDNVFVGKNSQTVITKNASEYVFSAYFMRWDGYGNPIFPYVTVDLSLTDVFGTEIFNTTVSTNQLGYSEYTYSGVISEQNYFVNWTSLESGWVNSQIESILPQLASKTSIRDFDFSEESIETMINLDADTTSFEDNLLNITSTGGDYWGFYNTFTTTNKDYSISAKMQRTGGTNSFMGITFFDTPGTSLSDDVFLIRPGSFDTILRVDGIETNPVLQTFSDTWYNIRADVTETQVKVYVNNILIATRINTNSRTNPSMGLYGFDSNAQVDFIRYSMLSNPDLLIAETETYSNSLNNSLINSVYSDNNYLGQYTDLTLIPLNLTGGSHNLTILPTKNVVDGLYTPEYSAVSTYTYTISEGGPFLVNVQSFSLSDNYVQTFVSATKDGTYTVYENNTNIGSGNFVLSGTAIQSIRENELGVLVFYALKFQNDTDVIWFNTTYSNAALATPPEGQPPVFIGVWYEGETIHIIDSLYNTFDIKSYYVYVNEFIIKHVVWAIPTNNLDWLEFSLPTHWSNVSLNIIETSLGDNTNNNYNYTTIYAGADYVLTAYSGEGYGYDYARQKQILAIEDISSDYLTDPGFETGFSDWFGGIAEPFTTISINSSIVYDGSFSLRLDQQNSYYAYLNKITILDAGEYYISFAYYIESIDFTFKIYTYNGGWDIMDVASASNVLNRWNTFNSFITLDGDTDGLNRQIILNFDDPTANGVIFIDNIRLWKASGSIENTAYSENTFSAQFISWDGYMNPTLSDIDVEWSLRDRTADTEIISQSLTTDEYGIASYTFKGTLEPKEYTNEWWSWYGLDYSLQELGDYWDFDEDIDSWQNANNYAISNVDGTMVGEATTVGAIHRGGLTIDADIYDKFSFYMNSNISSGSYISYLYFTALGYTEVVDILDISTTYSLISFDLSSDLIIPNWNGSMSTSVGLRINTPNPIKVTFDYIKLTMAQKSYFTPISAGSAPYSYETKYDGSDNYFDFSEGTENTESNVGSTIVNENGYLNVSDSSILTAFFGGISVISVDADFYNVIQIRIRTPNTAGLGLGFLFFNGATAITDTKSLAANDTWYTLEFPTNSDWSSTETNIEFYAYAITGITIIFNIDYIHLVHKTQDSGYSFDFNEEWGDIDESIGFNGWTTLYDGARESLTIENGVVDLAITNNWGGMVYIFDEAQPLTTSIGFEVKIKHISGVDSLSFEFKSDGINIKYLTITSMQLVGIKDGFDIYRYYHNIDGLTYDRLTIWDYNFGAMRYYIDYVRSLDASIDIITPTDTYLQINSDLGNKYSVWQDNIYLGIKTPTDIILKNNTVGTHEFLFVLYDALAITDLLEIPTIWAIYNYEIIASITAFLVNVQSFTLSDVYVQTFVTATKDGTYTAYENNTNIGSGSFVLSGTSIQSVRNNELGVLVLYALKFQNATDILWFNTTYSNAALITPPEGQPPVFIGIWYEGETIHLTTESNTYEVRSYYKYIDSFIIKHVIWVIPTNNMDWFEFSLPLHWSNVTLNVVETTLGSYTDNNYNYTTIYAGADYVLTAFSGEGYGSDYQRQKQIMALEDITSDYMFDGSFENGMDDWTDNPSNKFENVGITSNIVSDGEYALIINSTDATTDYLEFNKLDSGEYYISFDYYIIASDNIVYFQPSINDVDIIFDATTEKNKWHSYFFYFLFDNSIYDWIRFDAYSWQGEFIIDNIRLWKASGQIETIENQQYQFSSSFISWDGYINPTLPIIDVEYSLRERFTGIEITSQTLTTNEHGIASYTFKGTLDTREYENRWWSSDSWFDNGFIDDKIDFSEDEGFSGGVYENFNGVDTYKITTIASSTVSMTKTLSTLKTYDDNLLLSFRVYSEFTGSGWQIRNILYDTDGHIYFDIGNLVILNEFTTFTYQLSEYTVTIGDPDKLNSFSFGHYAYSSGLYVYWDYIKFIMPQKTYFTPLSAGYAPYSYETKQSGEKNYWDFSEETTENISDIGDGTYSSTDNGTLAWIADGTLAYAKFEFTNLDIDTSIYTHLQLRVMGNEDINTTQLSEIKSGSTSFFAIFDGTYSTSTNWQVFEIDLSSDPDWTGIISSLALTFYSHDLTTLEGNETLLIDHTFLVSKTYDVGRSWEFDEDLQGWDYSFIGSQFNVREWRDGSMYLETDGTVVRGTIQQMNSYSSDIQAGQTISIKITLSGTTNVRLYLYRPDSASWNAVWFNGLSVGVNYVEYLVPWTVNGLGLLFDEGYVVNGYVGFVHIIDADTSNPPLETDTYFQITPNSNEQYAVWLDDVYLGINNGTSIILKNNTLGSHIFEYALYKNINNDYSPQLTTLIQRYSYTVTGEGNMYIRFQNAVGQYIPFESFTSYYRFNSDPYSALGDNIIHFSEMTSTVDIFINDTYGNTVNNEIGVTYDNFHIIIIDAHEIFFSNQVSQSLLVQLKIPSASWSESVGYWIGLDSFRAIMLYNGTYDYRVLASDGSTILLASTPIDIDDDIAIELSEETDLGIYSYMWDVGSNNISLIVVTNHGDATISVWDESGYVGQWTESDNIVWDIPANITQSIVIFNVTKDVQKYGVLESQSIVRTFTYPITADDLGILQTDVRFFELDADTYAVEASSNHENTTIVITHDGVETDNETLGVYGLFGITKATAGGFHNVTVIISWTNSTGSTFTNTYIFDYWVDNYYSATYEVLPNSPGLKIASNEINMRSFNVYVDEVLITPLLPDDLRQQTTANINYTVIYDGYLFIRSTTYLHNITIKDKWDYPLFRNETDMREYTHLVIELPLVRATFVSERDEDVEVDMYLFNITSEEYELSGSVSVAAHQIVDGVWVIAGQYAIRVWGVSTDEVLINSETTTVQVFAEDVEYREGNKEDFGGLSGDGINSTLCAINPASCGVQYGYKIFKLQKYSYSSESSTDPFSDQGWLATAQIWIVQVWTDYKYWIIGVVVVVIAAFILFGNLVSIKNLFKKKKVKIEKTTKLPTPQQRREGGAGIPVYSKNKPPQKSPLPTITSRKKRKLPKR
ncbi:hypothetical protein LCGC14_0175970 [marine sediment metagenome]|uniref:Uncharacterized protein n=1 Tax=marine sediment metagenome TaxID=412755 RepID=A0A0F9XTU8_9ZZZZ